MKRKRTPAGVGLALRELRLDLRIDQRTLGARVGVSRGTINAWEVGKTLPPLGQRKRILDAVVKEAPRASYEAAARAFGFPAPAPPTVASSGTRGSPIVVVRAVADDLDVAPSLVRRAITAIAKRMREEGVGWEALEGAAASEKKRAPA
jgi:DNA-binding XRE family transcriptional regulator